MKSRFGHRTHNWFEAIVNKLGGEDSADAFLRGELAVSPFVCRWREQNGIIFLSVGEGDITFYEIAIIKGCLFLENDSRTTDRIQGMATDWHFKVPAPEIASLIRKKFTDEDLKTMGLMRIITMHKPPTNYDKDGMGGWTSDRKSVV